MEHAYGQNPRDRGRYHRLSELRHARPREWIAQPMRHPRKHDLVSLYPPRPAPRASASPDQPSNGRQHQPNKRPTPTARPPTPLPPNHRSSPVDRHFDPRGCRNQTTWVTAGHLGPGGDDIDRQLDRPALRALLIDASSSHDGGAAAFRRGSQASAATTKTALQHRRGGGIASATTDSNPDDPLRPQRARRAPSGRGRCVRGRALDEPRACSHVA